MNLDFNPWTLIAAFLFGVIGLWMFREGKRLDKTKILGLGLALMIYPYFVENPLLTWGIGCGLCGAAYYYWHR